MEALWGDLGTAFELFRRDDDGMKKQSPYQKWSFFVIIYLYFILQSFFINK